MTDQPTPSRRAGLRDEIANALEAADYRQDMRRGDLADAIMPVLYREWPWLRTEAEDAAIERVRKAVDALHADAASARQMGHDTAAYVLVGSARRISLALAEPATAAGQATAKTPACRRCPDPSCPEDCPECGSPIHDLDAVPSATPLVDRPFRSLRQTKEPS